MSEYGSDTGSADFHEATMDTEKSIADFMNDIQSETAAQVSRCHFNRTHFLAYHLNFPQLFNAVLHEGNYQLTAPSCCAFSN